MLSSVVACEGWVWLAMRPLYAHFLVGVVSYCAWLVACSLVWCRLALVCGFASTVCVGVLCWVAVDAVGWEQSFPALWLGLHVVTWDLVFWILFREKST